MMQTAGIFDSFFSELIVIVLKGFTVKHDGFVWNTLQKTKQKGQRTENWMMGEAGHTKSRGRAFQSAVSQEGRETSVAEYGAHRGEWVHGGEEVGMPDRMLVSRMWKQGEQRWQFPDISS